MPLPHHKLIGYWVEQLPLENGEYQLQQFRGSDRIVSMTFPKLTLTAEAIFQAAGR